MIQKTLELLTSPEYAIGVLSAVSVSILAYLVKTYVKVVRSWVLEMRAEAKTAEARDIESLLRAARRSDRVLLGLVLQELRVRLRMQASLLLSLFIVWVGAFVLVLYLAAESIFALPGSVSLALVMVSMAAIVLFVLSVSDEGDAVRHGKLLGEIFREEVDDRPPDGSV